MPTLMRGGHWPSAARFPLMGDVWIGFSTKAPGKTRKKSRVVIITPLIRDEKTTSYTCIRPYIGPEGSCFNYI